MRNLIIFLLFMSITGCSTPTMDEVAREICDGTANCTHRCPDGTITDARFPRCPINDRDLMPPSNDNIGLEGLDNID